MYNMWPFLGSLPHDNGDLNLQLQKLKMSAFVAHTTGFDMHVLYKPYYKDSSLLYICINKTHSG